MGKIIEAKNVIKEYGSFKNPFQALKGINLDIEEGEFLAIMGPSGSGKTTLLNLLATIDQATRGKIYIDGKYIRSYTEKQLSLLRREYISFIFQECNLLDNLTIRDNITSPLIIMGTEKEECDKRVESVSKRLGIDTILDKYPSECSGGQKQRISIARALVRKAPILILDDSTSALDMETEHELLANLRKRESNSTTFIIAHRISAVKNADIIVYLENGEIREIGKHNELVKKKGIYYDIYREQFKDFEALESEAI